MGTEPESAEPRGGQAPSLTERRRAATQLEIARTAATLFAERGADQVTAESIASAAGVSLRTFYRYFSTKEDAVAPLLSVGADEWQQALAAAAHGDPRRAVPEVIDALLVPTTDEEREGLRWSRGILRAMEDDAALRTVWARVNAESERRLRRIIAEHAGPSLADLGVRLLAAAATDAIRLGLEHWAAQGTDPDGSAGTPARFARAAFAQLSRGIEDAGGIDQQGGAAAAAGPVSDAVPDQDPARR